MYCTLPTFQAFRTFFFSFQCRISLAPLDSTLISRSSATGHLRNCLWMSLDRHTRKQRNKACDIGRVTTRLVSTKHIKNCVRTPVNDCCQSCCKYLLIHGLTGNCVAILVILNSGSWTPLYEFLRTACPCSFVIDLVHSVPVEMAVNGRSRPVSQERIYGEWKGMAGQVV